MTDTTQRVVEALEEMLKCAAFVKGAKDVDDYEIRAQQLVRLVENRAKRLLEAPTPPIPSTDEIEGIRARHEAWEPILKAMGHDKHGYAAEAHADRATLLRLLDASRAELQAEREEGLSAEAREVIGRAAFEIQTLEQIVAKQERREKRLGTKGTSDD